MNWFGESWGAAVCSPVSHAETPIAEPCAWCMELIEDGDVGVIIPSMGERGFDRVPFHLECHLRTIVGSVGHQRGLCSCFQRENPLEDPPGLSLREAASAAAELFRQNHP